MLPGAQNGVTIIIGGSLSNLSARQLTVNGTMPQPGLLAKQRRPEIERKVQEVRVKVRVAARWSFRRSRLAIARRCRSLTLRPCRFVLHAQNGARVIVTDVADGCAATGLVCKDDIICAINGTVVADELHSTEVSRSAVGEVVYSILRGNELIKVTAHKPQASTRLGVTVKNITAERMVNVELAKGPETSPATVATIVAIA